MPFYFFSNHKSATSFSFRLLKTFAIMNKLEFHSSAMGRIVIAPPDDRAYGDKDLIFYRNAEYSIADPLNVRGVKVIRNPLSTVASAYFSHIKTHRSEGWPLLIEHRDVLKSVSQDTGMALTIQFLELEEFFKNTAGPLYALSHWDDSDERFLTLRMEDMVKRPNEFLTKAITFLGYNPNNYRLVPEEKFTFKAMTGREVGMVNTAAHLRSGNPNDWHETLPEYIQEYIKVHYSYYLEKYYPDSLK